MRQSKYTALEQAELDETKTKEVRRGGLDLMSVRDRGWAKLDNGLLVRWHSDQPSMRGGTIPNGHFVIRTNHENLVFDAEELMRYLRWA